MPKYFPIVSTKTIIIEVPVGDSSEVVSERLQYDNRQSSKPAVEAVSAVALVMEVQKKALETVTAAFAAELTEINQKSVEAVSAVFHVDNQGKRATDPVAVVGQVAEQGKRADDTIQAVILPTADQAKKAVEDISNTVTATANDVAKRAIDSVSVVGSVSESGRKAIDDVAAEFVVTEVQKKAVEDISNTVTATANESAKRALENIEAAIVARTDEAKKALDAAQVSVSYTGYANENVSTTGWLTPANALGDTTATAATLTATSSGLAGLTSNTTSGTITLGLENPSPLIDDLSIVGPATIEIEREVTRGGTVPLGQTYSVAFEYQLLGAQAGGFIATEEVATSSGATRSNRFGAALALTPVTGQVSFVASDISGIDPSPTNINATDDPESRFITIPASTQSQDVIILLRGGLAERMSNLPSGYVLLNELVLTDRVVQVYRKTATAQDAGAELQLFTQNDTANQVSTGCVAVYRNASTVEVVTPFNLQTASTSSYTHPAIAQPSQKLICYLGGLFNTSTGNHSWSQAAARADAGASGTTTVMADKQMVPQQSGWQPIQTTTGTTANTAKGLVTATVPNLSMQDVDNLQVRAVGTVTSGTGIGATVTARVFRARVRFDAQGDY